MKDFIKADKPYAVTSADSEGKFKIVHPKDKAARQILAHETGQDVPTGLMIMAGLADKDGNAIVKEYDKVEAPTEPLASRTPAPAGYVSPADHAAAVATAAASVPNGYISESDAQARIDKAVADALANSNPKK